ncbi:MAG: hypothetical protein JSS66_02385 [Armatimonadetes bacterium]|nr:hypothetical protein [Armatimonadota bacterium]
MKAVLWTTMLVLASVPSLAGNAPKASTVSLGKKVVAAVLEYRLGDKAKPSFTSASAAMFSVSEEKVSGEGTVMASGKRRGFKFELKVRIANGNIRDVNIDLK